VTTATRIPRADTPLTAEHCRELALAADRAIPVRKAVRVASFNAWVTGIIAALSLPFALFSLSGLLVAVGLCAVACNEFRGRRRLLDFDPSAASILAWNQFGFLTLIVVYSVWATYAGLTGGNVFAKELAANPDLSALGFDSDLISSGDALYKSVLVAFYGTVIVLSVIFQGATAVYYATRRKYIQRYVAETPAWVRDLHRATYPS
jgi:hypothetical protein